MDNIIDIAFKIVTPNLILVLIFGVIGNLFVRRLKKSSSKKDMYGSSIFMALTLVTTFFKDLESLDLNIFALSLLTIVITLIFSYIFNKFFKFALKNLNKQKENIRR